VTPAERVPAQPSWTFLTHHAHVLLAVAAEPDALVQDIAVRVGITRRSTLSILRDLEEAGYVRRTRVGRRNHYGVNPRRPFRHQAQAGHTIGELLAVFTDPSSDGGPAL
jgi:predicted ArsR family transcriptional regulator